MECGVFYHQLLSPWALCGSTVMASKVVPFTREEREDTLHRVTDGMPKFTENLVGQVAVTLISGHPLQDSLLSIQMRNDRRGNTGISAPVALTTRRGQVVAGYIIAKMGSLYTAVMTLAALKETLYRDLEISRLLPHFTGSINRA